MWKPLFNDAPRYLWDSKKNPELCSVIKETVRMEEMKIDILGVYFIEIKVIKLHLPVQ